jgi:hypothetical protein
MWLRTWVSVPSKTGKIDLMKLKVTSSTPKFDLMDITALQTSSSVTETKKNTGTLAETETGTSKSILVLNEDFVKKTTEPLHINVAVISLGTVDDAKFTQIIVQFPRW